MSRQKLGKAEIKDDSGGTEIANHVKVTEYNLPSGVKHTFNINGVMKMEIDHNLITFNLPTGGEYLFKVNNNEITKINAVGMITKIDTITDTAAPNNSLYQSIDQGAYVIKDDMGVIKIIAFEE